MPFLGVRCNAVLDPRVATAQPIPAQAAPIPLEPQANPCDKIDDLASPNKRRSGDDQ